MNMTLAVEMALNIHYSLTHSFLGTERNFRKLREGVEVDLLGTKYDYGSVMHYGAYGFAVDRNIPTIIPLDPTATIGQRVKMSALDVERVQLLYGCKKAVSVFNPLRTA